MEWGVFSTTTETIKIAYSVPKDELLISSSRWKTRSSKQQSLPLRAPHSGITAVKMHFGRINILNRKIFFFEVFYFND
jgi:hypothetical protein